MSNTKNQIFLEIEERKNQEKKRERLMIVIISGLFFFVILAIILGLIITKEQASIIKDLIMAITTVLSGAIKSIVGYYFTKIKSKK